MAAEHRITVERHRRQSTDPAKKYIRLSSRCAVFTIWGDPKEASTFTENVTMPKFKILVTVVANWCLPVQQASANTVVLSFRANNPNAELNREVVLKLGLENEPTPVSAPPPSLMIVLRRFGY
jgi:hypothetical protein